MTFSYHRGIAPMVWVLFALALLELVVVHLFVSLKWPFMAWPLSLFTVISLIWLVRWIRSFKQFPHELRGDSLILHMGSLRTFDIPLDTIVDIHRTWPDGGHRGKAVRNLVPVAHPNRLIDLKQHLPGHDARFRIAIRLDDTTAFDAALKELGITFID